MNERGDEIVLGISPSPHVIWFEKEKDLDEENREGVASVKGMS